MSLSFCQVLLHFPGHKVLLVSLSSHLITFPTLPQSCDKLSANFSCPPLAFAAAPGIC
ncbi:hypothetical protein PAXRUDRAFT_766197 [Paxillus rubicundulus Ve08.2h10]|uniref:Uncharacterized protein n=1 Tax=Paxillus rubicundulus Ve08.2h10 TaxID=930991 RepID=A0A0D0DGV4_9AGAM|nr:hypothetical protein PAXRUDRAFT_766197 [Paxillus rubicundulus Ve08.2h10]